MPNDLSNKRAQAVQALQNFMHTREPMHVLVQAFAGDGSGNVDVPGRTNYIYARIAGDTSRLVQAFNTIAAPADGQLITLEEIRDTRSKDARGAVGYKVFGSANPTSAPPPPIMVTPHNLLSVTHPDTLTGGVVAGDLVTGNATPKWSRLAKGTLNYVLKSGASVLAWGQVAFSELTGALGTGQHGDLSAEAATQHAHTQLNSVTANQHHNEDHATRHQSAGADSIKLDDFATPDDNTDLNATTTYHGLLRKLDNDSTHYLDGTGAWSTPAGSGGGGGAAHVHGLARWAADGGATFDLPDIAEYVDSVTNAGSDVDSITYSLASGNTQIVFDSAPTAGNVVQCNYVIAAV